MGMGQRAWGWGGQGWVPGQEGHGESEPVLREVPSCSRLCSMGHGGVCPAASPMGPH